MDVYQRAKNKVASQDVAEKHRNEVGNTTSYNANKENNLYKNIPVEGRVPPFSFEAEQALLGSIMLDPIKFDSISHIVSPEDFYERRHRFIYEAMLSLDNAHQSIDLLSLQEELNNIQRLDEIGGQSYLMQISSTLPATVDTIFYARTIVNKARSRALLKACHDIEENVYAPQGRSICEILDTAEEKIFKIAESSLRKGGGPVSMSNVALNLVDTIQQNQANNIKGITGISSGYKYLDKYLSGFHKSDLIVIGARPGVGKTTFGMNLVQNVAMNPDVHLPVLVFSLEMPADQIAARLLAAMALVDQTRIRNSTLDADDWSRIIGVVGTLTSTKKDCIYIDDTQSLTPADIRARARRLQQEKGGLSMIMVDYLQYMHIPGYDASSRTQEVAECSKSLKKLARELDVPVLAMAQLNRGVAGRRDKRPGNSDLRESGAIEQDADVIMFIHRPEMDEDTKNDASLKGKAEIIIGKQRNGPIGTVPMVFRHEFSRFETLDLSANVAPPPDMAQNQ